MKRKDLMNFAPMPEKTYASLMAAARSVEEELPVKRNLSVVLVFALAMALLAGIAYAAISLRDAGRQVVVTEQTEGYYFEWPVKEKIALVSALVDLGYVEETAEVKRLIANSLPEDEAHRVADEALIAFTGLEVSEISFMDIMQAAWGPFEQWSKEEQAWYSQLMVEMNIQKDDHTLYVEPEGPVDEAQAIAIARREIAKGYGIEESALNGYTVVTSFQAPEFAEPGDKQAYWYVELTAPENMPEDERPFGMFWVFIHPETGKLLESVESMRAIWEDAKARRDAYLSYPLNAAIHELYDPDNYEPLWDRTLEQKAEYSKKINPLVQAMLDSGDLSAITDSDGQVDYSIIAASTYTYGLPGNSDISQERALDLAYEAVRKTYGLDKEIIKNYDRVLTFFDISNPEKSLWRFVLHYSLKAWARDYDRGFDNPQSRLSYRVELDARTGEVVQIEEFDTRTGGDWTDLESALKGY